MVAHAFNSSTQRHRQAELCEFHLGQPDSTGSTNNWQRQKQNINSGWGAGFVDKSILLCNHEGPSSNSTTYIQKAEHGYACLLTQTDPRSLLPRRPSQSGWLLIQ